MVVRDEHPVKAPQRRESTFAPIVTDVRLEHPLKEVVSITLTLDGITTPVSPVQSQNVLGRILVIPLGIVIVPVIPEHPWKANLPIYVTPVGITKVPVIPEHPLKAELPI